MDKEVVSSDEDLAEFLAGLRQRYNLEAPEGSPTTVAAAAATVSATAPAAEGTSYASGTSSQRAKSPGISTDAAILGLHPAFRGTATPELPSPSLRSGQPPSTAATAGVAEDPEAAAVTAAACVASPAAQSESGSCGTPQPQNLSASQLATGATAAAAGRQATPTDVTVGGGAWEAGAAGAAPAGGLGAVAAAATPHSTAAMPVAWRLEQQGTPVGQQLAAADTAVAAHHASLEPAATAAAAATGEAFEPPARSSGSSSPGSIAKPLFEQFTAAAAAEADDGTADHPARQQPQQQEQQQQGSGSEVTFKSLLDSPRNRQQRTPQARTESPQQQQLPLHAPPALSPGSPSRPLLGAWAARAAAASGSPSGSSLPIAHPAGVAVGSTSPPPPPAAAVAAAVVKADEQEGAAAVVNADEQEGAAVEAPADSCSDSAVSPCTLGQQQQQQQVVEEWQHQQREQQQDQSAEASVNWGRLSSQLSAAGFGHLALTQQQGGQLTPELTTLHDNLGKVLDEYRRRDGLMQQLLSERDEVRRSARRTNAESSKLERERDDAVNTAAKLKTELSDVRSVEIPALESRYREALSKLNSEVLRLKHAAKEAEAVAAAAQAEVLASSTQPTLQAELNDAVRERERLRLECERLQSELSRQRPLIKELEKSTAAARAASRQTADQAVLLDKQLRQLRQQHQEEQTALTAELNRARHAAREAEQQLIAARADAASSVSEAPELLRQLAAERLQHEEQQAHLASELQGLRQQVMQLQQAAAKAEAAAKADSSAATHASKQLALQEKQHKAEVAKLSADWKQAREALQLLQAKLIQAEATAAEQSAAATGAEAAAVESADRAAAAVADLDRMRAAHLHHQQQLNEQLQDSKRVLTECQQQLASTQGELRRLRAAAALADATAGAAAGPPGSAAAAVTGVCEGSDREAGALGTEGSSSSGLGLQPRGPARTVHAGADGDSSRSSSRAGAAAAAAATDVASATATGDLAAALSRAVAAEAAAADAEGSLVGLKYRCMQLEMSCNRKEQELDALRDKLAQKVTREERRLARDKSVYQRIKQAYAASGGAAAGRKAALAAAGGSSAWSAIVEVGPGTGGAAGRRSNAAGAVVAAARELRPVELVGIYEGQKEALEKELAAARAEVRVLSGQLRDAQNLLISRDRAAAVAAAAAGLKASGLSGKLGDPAAAAATQRKAAELQRELCTVRAEAASALREAAKRLAGSEAGLLQLRGDVNALQEELDNRPAAADHRRLQREVDLLQRKIAAVRRQAASRQPGGAAAAGEDVLSAAAAAGDVWGGDDSGAGGSGRGRGTKTAIERDKALARLGLHVAEEFPRDVLVDIVQDMCIVLELRDATLLVPSLKKVAAVAAAIPSVEAFVAQVCEVVLREGLAFTPAEVQDTGLGPKCVPKVLQHWLLLLRQGELLTQFAGQLQELVSQRCGAGQQGPGVPVAAVAAAGDSAQLLQLCQQLIQEVQLLLQVEAEAVASSDVLGAAKGLLVSQPEGILQRLLGQVMDLMGVQQLEGLPAAVNRVYVHYNELLNFLRAAVSLLALPSDAGPSAVMAALAKLVEQAARPPSKVRQAAAELQAAAGLQQQDHWDDHHRQQQQQLWEGDSFGPKAAAAAATAAADERLSGLLAALGAVSEQQAADRHKEMVTRLRRLDQVLPKYQSVVSQLYDRLRVVSLDELLPAVDRILAQHA